MATITDTGSSLDFSWPNDYYDDFLSLPYDSIESIGKEKGDLCVKFTLDRFDTIYVEYGDITSPTSTDLDDLIQQLTDAIQASMGNLNGEIRWNSIITPPALTGATHDYNPSGFEDANVLRVDGGAGGGFVDITGFDVSNINSGHVFKLFNVGTTKALRLRNNNGSSLEANRIMLPSSFIDLNPDEAIIFWYDNAISRWRPIYP